MLLDHRRDKVTEYFRGVEVCYCVLFVVLNNFLRAGGRQGMKLVLTEKYDTVKEMAVVV